MDKEAWTQLFKVTVKELDYLVACIRQMNSASAAGFTRRVGQATVSKMAAAGAVSGVLGLVATFGTAGTGTAIASLSGAAATSATMAWVGSLLGGGVAVGSVMTGGLALAVGIGAYTLMASKARKYEDLTDLERQIVDACIILKRAFEEAADQGEVPPLKDLAAIYERSLLPLYCTVHDNEKTIASNLDFKNSLALSVHAIPDLRRRVIEPFRTALMKEA